MVDKNRTRQKSRFLRRRSRITFGALFLIGKGVIELDRSDNEQEIHVADKQGDESVHDSKNDGKPRPQFWEDFAGIEAKNNQSVKHPQERKITNRNCNAQFHASVRPNQGEDWQ